ncbi:PqqD family protein [Pyxidicoccus parkwayensis]|uniref:PqqD family protein n=1 Tax=Pyxidicoccus parkwayensis TaxID=2813578 RepID=A0ABX7P9S9_9BACT|nr:PqqD family protein [Pyxidicoccus parkwaysis]QSQ27165.1 PqqD family protein [Pyxidicoccus parkwaysis]
MVLPRAAAGVIVQQQQDAFFLMDTEGGEVFRVNETAARIFELCRSGGTLEDAVQALSRGMGESAPIQEIAEDVRSTVTQFQELGLCEPSSVS